MKKKQPPSIQRQWEEFAVRAIGKQFDPEHLEAFHALVFTDISPGDFIKQYACSPDGALDKKRFAQLKRDMESIARENSDGRKGCAWTGGRETAPSAGAKASRLTDGERATMLAGFRLVENASRPAGTPANSRCRGGGQTALEFVR